MTTSDLANKDVQVEEVKVKRYNLSFTKILALLVVGYIIGLLIGYYIIGQ